MTYRLNKFYLLLSILVVLMTTLHAEIRQLNNVGIDKGILGNTIDRSLQFQDQNGKNVTLNDYFKKDKPVILIMAYYGCPQLCTLVLNGLADGLNEMAWKPGHNYQVVTVSIDPRETPELAKKKQVAYAKKLNMNLDGKWSFLVGTQKNIDILTNQLGFRYNYIEKQDEYAHPACVYVLGDKANISVYFSKYQYSERDLKYAIIDASEGKVGSVADLIIQRCFVYNESQSKYVAASFVIMKIGGGLTLLFIVSMMTYYWREEIFKLKKRGKYRLAENS